MRVSAAWCLGSASTSSGKARSGRRKRSPSSAQCRISLAVCSRASGGLGCWSCLIQLGLASPAERRRCQSRTCLGSTADSLPAGHFEKSSPASVPTGTPFSWPLSALPWRPLDRARHRACRRDWAMRSETRAGPSFGRVRLTGAPFPVQSRLAQPQEPGALGPRQPADRGQKSRPQPQNGANAHRTVRASGGEGGPLERQG